MSQKLLTCTHLSKRFGNHLALDNVSLEIPRGRIVGLLGRNGAGKTTLIKLMNDLLIPTAGAVRVNGQPLGIASKLAISYLPEQTYLDPTMRVRDAVAMFTEFYPDFDADKALQLIADLELEPDTRISHMSKGMREKLQLILVVSRRAELYILDEPLGGVDPATRDYILDTILANFSDDASLLISTHLITDIERILDEVIFIDRGRIVLQADADELRRKHHASIDEIFRQTFKPGQHDTAAQSASHSAQSTARHAKTATHSAQKSKSTSKVKHN